MAEDLAKQYPTKGTITVTYSCGCKATGVPPLPPYCPDHLPTPPAASAADHALLVWWKEAKPTGDAGALGQIEAAFRAGYAALAAQLARAEQQWKLWESIAWRAQERANTAEATVLRMEAALRLIAEQGGDIVEPWSAEKARAALSPRTPQASGEA